MVEYFFRRVSAITFLCFLGRIFKIAKGPEDHKSFIEMLVLIELVSGQGGKCVTRASEATIYVEVESTKVCRRIRIIDEKIKKGKLVKKQNIDEFLNYFGITYPELLEMGEKFRLSHIGKILK
jgi:hypothetical protein